MEDVAEEVHSKTKFKGISFVSWLKYPLKKKEGKQKSHNPLLILTLQSYLFLTCLGFAPLSLQRAKVNVVQCYSKIHNSNSTQASWAWDSGIWRLFEVRQPFCSHSMFCGWVLLKVNGNAADRQTRCCGVSCGLNCAAVCCVLTTWYTATVKGINSFIPAGLYLVF